MKRDGFNKSLWQEINVNPGTTVLPQASYDVLIVGGGMTGVVTALSLQLSGKTCLLVEAHTLGFGTTGGTTAHLNTLLDTPYTTITKNFSKEASQIIAKAAANVIDDIEGKINQYSIPCEFERTSAYLFSQEKQETNDLIKIFEASQEAGIEVALSKELPIRATFEKVLKVSNQAKFHPIKYLFALATQFEKAGGKIVTNCAVLEVKDDDQHNVIVSTSKGDIATKQIIFATHIPLGVNILHLRCAPWRSYAMAVKLKNNAYPEGLVYDMKDPYHYYRTQLIDNQPYLIVGGKDHKTGEQENTELPFRELRAHIESIFDVNEITHHWSSQYFEPADGIPYIGHLPGHSENYYVATGFGGNGMIYSHVAAKEITSLINTGESAYSNLFSPSRVKPVAGFSNFISHNTAVVKHFVGKFFGSEELNSFTEIAAGEGKIVDINGTSVALSKDHNGAVHAVAPECTHLKCQVSWNITEQSWDCPCHGARYSSEGKVLTGPASHGLEKLPLATLENSDSKQA